MDVMHSKQIIQEAPVPVAAAAATISNNPPVINAAERNRMFRNKNPGVLEKEKQMKFLLEIFPNLDAMVSM